MGHIDGLRGYLALLVVCHHFMIWTLVQRGGPWAAPSSHLFNNFGQASVALFFMVTGALFSSKVTPGWAGTNWYAVYISRIFRLTPLMWAATAVLIIRVLVKGRPDLEFSFATTVVPILSWMTFVSAPNILGFQNTWQIIAGVTWSLVFEWKFYLLLPVIALVFGAAKKHLSQLQIASLLSVIALVTAGLQVLRFMPLFFIGMVAKQLSDTRAAQFLKTRLASLIGIAALGIELFVFEGAFGPVQYILLGLFFAPIVSGNSYFHAFDRRGSVALGELSYPIYLLHGFVLDWFMTGSVQQATIVTGASSTWVFLPVLMILVIGAALVAHHAIEKPGISMGKKVVATLKTRQTRSQGATHSSINA